jgi:monovalent cation:H+ antiporter, CPA1 family
MEMFPLVSALIVLCSLLAYINHRFVKLPGVIGLLVLSMASSFVLWLLSHLLHIQYAEQVEAVIGSIDFSSILLEVMLCFMLFAGAFHANLTHIRSQAKSIGIMAIGGTIISTGLVASILYGIGLATGLHLSFMVCLLFGALISPTDPIAVLGILNKTNIPERMKVQIVGESLFNDGVGIVLFATILEIIESGVQQASISDILLLFLREAGGGMIFGILLGWLAYRVMRSIDHYQTETLITLAIVMGGYTLAHMLHISGPLAMVVAGLIMGGEKTRQGAMSHTTELYLDKFWETVDELLNALLFLLLGLRLITLPIEKTYLLAGVLTIAGVLLARFVSLAVLKSLFNKYLQLSWGQSVLMVWCGLRGGLSFAMALSIIHLPEKQPIVFITYIVVLFSIIVQGLTIEKLAKKVA